MSNIIKPWNQGFGAGTNMQLLRLQLWNSVIPLLRLHWLKI